MLHILFVIAVLPFMLYFGCVALLVFVAALFK